MKPELIDKLSEFLEDHGHPMYFSMESDPPFQLYEFESWECCSDFISFSLMAVTGLLARVCTVYDPSLPVRIKNIKLINELASLLYESGDEELKAVAWNTFYLCKDDKRFVLAKEIKKARSAYFDAVMYSEDWPLWNKTPEAKTERLIVKPLMREEGSALVDYVHDCDPEDSGPFGPYVWTPGINNWNPVFGIHLKDGEEGPIGSICLFFNRGPLATGIANVSCYIKKEHRRKGYAKEAFAAVYDLLKQKKFSTFGCYHRFYAIEEARPEVKDLIIDCEESDIGARKTAESFGFSLVEDDIGLNEDREPGIVWYHRKIE